MDCINLSIYFLFSKINFPQPALNRLRSFSPDWSNRTAPFHLIGQTERVPKITCFVLNEYDRDYLMFYLFIFFYKNVPLFII